MRTLTRVPGVRLAAGLALVLGVVQLLSAPSGGYTSGSTFANYTNLNTDSGRNTSGRVPADVYPSPITVSGLSGTVTHVSVTFPNFTVDPEESDQASYPDDADILMAAPDPTHNLVVMSDVGGDNGNSNPVVGANLVIDDDAPAPFPANVGFGSGHYKPTDDDGDQYSCPPCGPDEDFWGAPAPAPSAATTMAAAFNGIDPNGTWNLYVWDDTQLGNFHLYGGWCLNIVTTVNTAAQGTCSVPDSTTTTNGITTTTSATTIPRTTTTTGPPPPTTTTTTRPAGTTKFPSTVKASTGSGTGTVASLTADDNSYYVVKSGTKVTSWFGTFTSVPKASVKTMRVTYIGKQSQNASQVIYVYRYSTGSWVAVNTTPVGTTETTVDVALPGSASDWVSGTGQMKVRVKSTGTSGALTTSGDLLSVTYTT